MVSFKPLDVFEFLNKQHTTAEDVCTKLAFVNPTVFISLANIQRPDFPLPTGNSALELFELYMKLKEYPDKTEILRRIFDTTKSVSENRAILQNWITTLKEGGML